MSTTSSSQVAAPTSPPRPGRLRGLSYLRHYAHGHAHSPSQAAPTVVTAANVNSSNGNATTSSPSLTQQPTSPPTTTAARARSTSPLNNTASNAWLPTVSGVSGLSRVASQPSAELSTSTGVVTSNGASNVRSVSNSAPAVRSIDEALSTSPDAGPPTHQPNNSPLVRSPSNTSRVPQPSDPAASIRFIPHVDTRATRESLIFTPIERILRFKDEHIRVGRYSDRDQANPSAPVGFKSKVVSRRHCEFWCDNGQWYIKDVKSSSGTFLNHIRLSAPGVESRAYPLYDGDILQLGIDFKGGEEQIFRCVKIRVELNRAWQKALNKFNMSAHRRIRNLAKTNPSGNKAIDGDTSSTHTSECSICLMPVAPCQSLFVAPCSHVWHYKCIRPLVEKEYPTFLCPNCRAIADLEKDIEDDDLVEELWESMADVMDRFADEQTGRITDALESMQPDSGEGDAPPIESTQDGNVVESQEPEPAGSDAPAPAALPSGSTSTPTIHPVPETATPPIEIQQTPSGSWRRRGERVTDLDLRRDSEPHTPEPDKNGSGSTSNGNGSSGEGGQEGPMTPMNDAGPFVFDGGAMDSAAAAVSPTATNPPNSLDDINNSDWRSAIPN
ncbi:unnamed protein product [Tuber melanosporum]|uniref:RING-type E3 ubiquitin transferase n=1 Tax=Tuber melanosporum (strain Mel28) TaxID=656061 RepID=D5GH28_TUBMM|nr:uncharacterized protein GSTUM_00007674001 [Tuber melanosporum]CAZ83821.1 unnamed protein product [Tuber melanosporum]